MAPATADHFAIARATARELRFDASRQVRLEALIIALSSRGFEPSDDRIPLYLGPLLNGPETRSDTFLLNHTQSAHPSNGDNGAAPNPPKIDRWTAKELLRAGAALATLLLVAVVVAMKWPRSLLSPDNTMKDASKINQTSDGSGVLPPPPPPDLNSLYLLNVTVIGCIAALVALSAIMVIAWPHLRRWWEKRQMRQLRRDPLPDRSRLVTVSTALARARLFSDPALTIALRKLRRHRAAPSIRIDVRRSIRATILNGKIPTLRFARRRLSPDYLLLSERERPHDHLAEVATAWRERLNEAKIACEHYEFFGDPNTLRQIADSAGRSTGPGARRERLDSVLARHDGADVVVMFESFDALASADGDPQWLARAGLRAKPHLMNPREPRFWSQLETRLDELGMPAFSASVAGTLELADRIDRTIDDAKAEEAPLRTPGHADLAAFLAAHRSLVLSPDRPADAQVATIIDTLQRWLDADAFDWLRALAVFPMINSGFTFFAGCALKESTIVTHDRYLALARLPWLRAAYMPDWFRLALVKTLSPAALSRAGATAAAFLQPPEGVGESEQQLLELRRQVEKAATLKSLAQKLESGGNPALNDRLLIEILRGTPPDELGVMIDRDIAEDPTTQHRRDTWLVIAMNAMLMVGLLILQPASWQRDGLIPIGESTDPVEQSKSEASSSSRPDAGPTPQPKTSPPSRPTPESAPIDTTPTPEPSPSPDKGSTPQPAASKIPKTSTVPADDPKPLPAPDGNATTRLETSTSPPPTAISGTTARLYIQYALREQEATATAVAEKLDGFDLDGVVLGTAQIENRGAQSPSDTQLRCFEDSGCAVGAQLQPQLRSMGVDATLVRFRPIDLARAAKQPNTMELWFGTGPSSLEPRQVPKCKPATSAEVAGPWVVFFDWDKYLITPEATMILDNVIYSYRCGFNIMLNGHTDDGNTEEYSLALSQRYNDAVKAYLVSKGIPNSAITTRAFGNSQVDPTADGVRAPQNRRVEITLSPGKANSAPPISKQ